MAEQKPVGDNRPPCESALKIEEIQNKIAEKYEDNAPESANAAATAHTAPPPAEENTQAASYNGQAPQPGALQAEPPTTGGPQPEPPQPEPPQAEPPTTGGPQPEPPQAEPPTTGGPQAEPLQAKPGTPPPPAPPAAVPAGYAAASTQPSAPFNARRADGIFAIAVFVLGFLAARWLFWNSFQGWGVTGFCLLFAAGILLYARGKGITPPRQSWYWLAITLLCGLSYSLWPGGLLTFPQALLTSGAGIYWCASLFGILLEKKTGNYLFMDAINLLFVVPFCNFGCLILSFKGFSRQNDEEKRHVFVKRVLPLLLGLLLCIPLLAVVLPLLERADSGNFGRLYNDFLTFLNNLKIWKWITEEILIIIVQAIMGIPIAFWLCGLVAGAAHKRHTGAIDVKKVKRAVAAARIVPAITVLVVMAVASVVYGIFIGCQLPYFFSAFGGVKPEQFNVYSEYAREGFFELCRIAAINLGLMALGNVLCKTGDRAQKWLKVFSVLLSLLTLLVITTAFSKMGLYIVRQGFTPKRIMTCVFMLFLAGVCLAAIARQFRAFSIVRFSAVLGSAMLCALCLCNLDGLVVRYNAAQYLNGSLPGFDALIVLRSGSAGLPAAMEVYDTLDDADDYEDKQRLAYAITTASWRSKYSKGTARDTVADARARRLDLPWDPEQSRLREEMFYAFYYADGYYQE